MLIQVVKRVQLRANLTSHVTGHCLSMASLSSTQSKMPPPKKTGKPRSIPTHFLCLPLVNSTSIPQLESSLEAFKAENPPTPTNPLLSNGKLSSNGQATVSVIPEGAHRPLGTIHLTLGVMNLASPQQLDGALRLFESLDLVAIMREAEALATSTQDASGPWHVRSPEGHSKPQHPLIVSLESLYALPRQKKATVLYAKPLDPTGRLWPFCVLLRNHFIRAGLIDGDPSHPREASQISIPDKFKGPKNRDRPLLLHATLVNTIYVRGRPDRSKPQKGPKRPQRLEMDAESLVEKYQDYYTDETRTLPRCAKDTPTSTPAKNFSNLRYEEQSTNPTSNSPQPKYPFVWAQNIPIQSVCICEMGAKNIGTVGAGTGGPNQDDEVRDLSTRLGQEYTVVAKRDLNF